MSRKLDAKLAEALGYELDVSISKYGWYYMVTGEVCSVKTKSVVPLYSTDGNAMLELDREMRERGGDMESVCYMNEFMVQYWQRNRHATPSGRATAGTMPEAVALAAYKALTGKEWTE